MNRPQLHLTLNLQASGAHPAAWLVSGSGPTNFLDASYYVELAKTAERGLFDAVFLADGSYLRANAPYRPWPAFDPVVIATAVARETSHIGSVISLSTTFHHPYTIARTLSTLDHLSGGRIGWNVVTTRDAPAGRNYGFDELPARAERYRRAEEAVEVARALWDSWAEDALVADRATGVMADLGKVRPIDHHGEFFDVAGPLQIPRSPQGRPALFQAGGSAGGVTLASREADAVFTVQPTLAHAQTFRTQVREQVAAAGRDPEQVRILPGLVPIIGSDQNEAKRRQDELFDVAEPMIRHDLGERLGIDADTIDLDAPVPEELVGPITGPVTGSVGFDTAVRESLATGDTGQRPSFRQFFNRGGLGGHPMFVGSPERIADVLQDWFEQGGADGFTILPDVCPDGVEIFVDHVVPILQQRGLFRTEYRERTLRERLKV